nr:MAG TPA: Thymidylate synthase complementing protein [Caudoviricetes sp.]
METNKISAKIVAHSIREGSGEELISYELVYPRIILAEVNTHKMLSKNTSSSRAIPFEKMVEIIEKDPFIPIAWQKHHKGMQGVEYFENTLKQIEKDALWLKGRDAAVKSAKDLYEAGVTKQLCNRILEPYMWVKQLITGTREGFENLFELRCPKYKIQEISEAYKSKKEAIENHDYLDGEDYMWWLKHNTGQAEIHFMDLAEKMYDALRESNPVNKSDDDWHIPFFNNYSENEDVELLIKESVCKTARISYTKFGDEDNKMSEEKIKSMYEDLAKKKHYSCFEHIGKVMKGMEYPSHVRGDLSKITPETARKIVGWNKNFKGFIQLRHYLENK